MEIGFSIVYLKTVYSYFFPMQYIISCPGWCSQLLKNELKVLWFPLSQVLSPSTVQLEADESAIAKINVRSRIANKVFIILAEGIAPTFDRLFDIIQRVDRKKYIKEKQPFIVNARTHNSQLTSIPSLQSTGKKAISQKLMGNDERREEDNTVVPVEIVLSLEQNNLQILLNTTGDSLHKRGYRTHAGEAPLKENLAAALVLAAGRKFGDRFHDITCWSGTILIEAAMIAKNIAPWLKRDFAFETFDRYSHDHLNLVKKKAMEAIITSRHHTIIGSDIDEKMIEIAKKNAENAWVGEYIEFSVQDLTTLPETEWCFVSNPPYGERLQPENLKTIYDTFEKLFHGTRNYGWIITSYEWQPKWHWDTKSFYNGPDKVIFRKKKL